MVEAPTIPPNRSANPRLGWVACAVIAVVTFISFASALRNGFVDYDDAMNFTDNSHYRGLGGDNIRWAFTTFLGGPYQPLSWISLSVDYALWGMNPTGYHLGNVIYHALTAMIFFSAALRLLTAASGSTSDATAISIGATIAALLFAIHPLRVESVAWATERRDVLSGLFLMLTVRLYLWGQDADGRRAIGLIAAFIAYLLSLSAKSIGMTLPLLLLILDWYPLRRFDGGGRQAALRTALLEKIPFLLAAIAAAVPAFVGQRAALAMQAVDTIGPMARGAIACYAACFYLFKTIWPARLFPMYPIPANLDFAAAKFPLAVLVVVLVTAMAWRRRRARWPLAAWTAYLLLLAPVSGLVLCGRQIAADRYTYLPGMVIALLAGGAAARMLMVRRTFMLLAAGVVVAILTVATVRQTHFWHDSESLWAHTLACDPQNPVAHTNFGFGLQARHQPAAALGHYREAARLDPFRASYRVNVSAALFDLGRFDEAIQSARGAVVHDPRLPAAHHALGIALAALEKNDEALAALRSAIDLDPSDARPRQALASTLAKLGRTDEATREIRSALSQCPPSDDLFGRSSQLLAEMGHAREAIDVVRSGVERLPADDKLRLQWAWLLATVDDDAVRDGNAASRIAGELKCATAAADPMIAATVAAARADAGQFAEAARILADARKQFGARMSSDQIKLFDKMDRDFSAARPHRTRAAAPATGRPPTTRRS